MILVDKPDRTQAQLRIGHLALRYGHPDTAALAVAEAVFGGMFSSRLMQEIRGRGATSVRCAVLLWKKSRTVVNLQPDYFGFEIPDEFVVGFGLDFDDDYRHLPYIGVLESR